MPIEKKSGLFYELLIRGNWNPQATDKDGQPVPLGAIMTYQMQTGSALIDTDTNTLAAHYIPDPPKDLTKEQAVEFLEGKLADFIDQISTRDQQIDDLKAAAHIEKIRADKAAEAAAEAAEIAAQKIAELSKAT